MLTLCTPLPELPVSYTSYLVSEPGPFPTDVMMPFTSSMTSITGWENELDLWERGLVVLPVLLD